MLYPLADPRYNQPFDDNKSYTSRLFVLAHHPAPQTLEGCRWCLVLIPIVVAIPGAKILLARFEPSQHSFSSYLAFNAHRFRTISIARLRAGRVPWFKRPWIAAKTGGIHNNDSTMFDQIVLETFERVILRPLYKASFRHLSGDSEYGGRLMFVVHGIYEVGSIWMEACCPCASLRP
jgi:hypothetical protein